MTNKMLENHLYTDFADDYEEWADIQPDSYEPEWKQDAYKYQDDTD